MLQARMFYSTESNVLVIDDARLGLSSTSFVNLDWRCSRAMSGGGRMASWDIQLLTRKFQGSVNILKCVVMCFKGCLGGVPKC